MTDWEKTVDFCVVVQMYNSCYTTEFYIHVTVHRDDKACVDWNGIKSPVKSQLLTTSAIAQPFLMSLLCMHN
jgi:hypothetical protein